MRKSSAFIAVCILGLFIAAGSMAFAQGFASADADKIFREYEKRIKIYGELEILKDKLEHSLELRNGNKLLTEEEFKQLADLDAKAQKTDADNTRIRELLNTSRQRDQELQALQQKSDLTDEERTKRTELEDRLRNVNRVLQEDKAKYENELNTKLIQANEEISRDIENAISAEAKANGYSMVFNKSFGSVEFILYSTVDITDAVIKKLNQK